MGDLVIEPVYRSLLVQHGLDSLGALLEIERGQSLNKRGLPRWRQRVRLELRGPEGGVRVLYLKRYVSPPPRAQLRRIVFGQAWHSSAWMEWCWARLLREAGIPAVQPVAYGEDMIGPWERRSVLVTAEVPGESLERWVQRSRRRAPRELLERLARFVADFHRCGLVHRDLYLSHVFIDETDPRGPRLRLIDLQRVMRPRWRRQRWVVKDLASLNYSVPPGIASATDRLRWLRVYLDVPSLRPRDKRLVRRIVAKTCRIARHDRRCKHNPPAPGRDNRP